MSALDWLVLVGTIAFIAIYGAWKTRGVRSTKGYLKGEDLRWPTIGLSIMATQASAITFLSVPGQAYEDGMRFVQFYFGLPIAMVIISAVFVPIYHRLQVYTAYEYLEQRFDVKVRVLAAVLFMIGRGLAAGISIYAPAIILSSVMGWSLSTLNVLIGGVVVLYTVSGGAAAVSQTQKQQMVVILAGIAIAAVVITYELPDEVGVSTAATLAGALGRMNVVDFRFDPSTRYTFWSGITGGLFLSLSYFGTDQSQVQRYLGGASVTESRLGLLFNGILKIPMQFVILFIGILVFVFYLFERPPVFFDRPTLEAVRASEHGPALEELEARWDQAFQQRLEAARFVVAAETGRSWGELASPRVRRGPPQRDSRQGGGRRVGKGRRLGAPRDQAVVISPGETLDPLAARAELAAAQQRMDTIRGEAKELIGRARPDAELEDSDYIFVSFVLDHLPSGLVGLLLAVIFLASMSTTASELNALGSTSVIDLYRRLLRPDADERHTLWVSKLFTVFWGLVAVAFASFAALLDNLIEAVNILGSIFYGVILGIFVTAFFVPWVRANAVLLGAVVAQAVVVALFFTSDIGFLWFNVIGCALVVGLAVVAQAVAGGSPKGEST